MSKFNNFGLLYKFEYPPYQIICSSINSFVVCGGGSSSYKSGIPNKIELFDILRVNADDSTALPVLKNRTFFDTDKKIATSLGIHFNYLLTAEKNDLCEYILLDNQNMKGDDGKIDDETKVTEEKQLDLKSHRRISDVFVNNNGDAEISIVKYCGTSGSLLIAGGNNGSVKIFQRYNEEKPMDLVLMKEIPDVSGGHNHPIIDLDVSPNGEEFVSICEHPDGKYARVWNINRSVKVTELALMSPQSKKLTFKCPYKFKHCRYSSTYFSCDSRPSFLLYATHHPTKRNEKSPSYMSVWGPGDPGTGNDYQLIDVIHLGNNKAPFFNSSVKLVPSSLAVSCNGLLSSIGSTEGQVDVYRFNPDSSLLALIYRLPSAHSFIVTDMAFMPSSRVLATGHEFELLSVGMDNMLRYHRQKAHTSYLKLDKLYSLLCVVVVMILCDRLLLLLNLW